MQTQSTALSQKLKTKGKKKKKSRANASLPFPLRLEDRTMSYHRFHNTSWIILVSSFLYICIHNSMQWCSRWILLLLDKIYQLFPTLLLDETNKHTSRINHVCTRWSQLQSCSTNEPALRHRGVLYACGATLGQDLEAARSEAPLLITSLHS